MKYKRKKIVCPNCTIEFIEIAKKSVKKEPLSNESLEKLWKELQTTDEELLEEYERVLFHQSEKQIKSDFYLIKILFGLGILFPLILIVVLVLKNC